MLNQRNWCQQGECLKQKLDLAKAWGMKWRTQELHVEDQLDFSAVTGTARGAMPVGLGPHTCNIRGSEYRKFRIPELCVHENGLSEGQQGKNFLLRSLCLPQPGQSLFGFQCLRKG